MGFCVTDGGNFDDNNRLIPRGARVAIYVDGRTGGSSYESVILPVDWRVVPKTVSCCWWVDWNVGGVGQLVLVGLWTEWERL